jgi:hypothetical protein
VSDLKLLAACSLSLGLALSACQTPPSHSVAPAPTLTLMQSAALELAEGCTVSGSFVIEFTVDVQGRTTDIERPIGPPCVQDALIAWVATFRYTPPAVPTPGSVEWLLVTAPKGS